MERDVNDVFDDILFCEEQITESAYEEGIKKGQSEGNPEGYHLGYHRGAEIGAELGYYLGVVQVHLGKEENKAKKVYASLEKLKQLIESFPKTNDDQFDITGGLDEIRALYRKACSLLKIDGKFPEADKLNF